MDTKFLWLNTLFFLHANIERVNGGFVVFSPFNSTLEMQQVMGDFVRLCSRVGVLGAKKENLRDKEYQKPFLQNNRSANLICIHIIFMICSRS